MSLLFNALDCSVGKVCIARFRSTRNPPANIRRPLGRRPDPGVVMFINCSFRPLLHNLDYQLIGMGRCECTPNLYQRCTRVEIDELPAANRTRVMIYAPSCTNEAVSAYDCSTAPYGKTDRPTVCARRHILLCNIYDLNESSIFCHVQSWYRTVLRLGFLTSPRRTIGSSPYIL